MNIGSWFHSHPPNAWTRELRKTNTGEVMDNVAPGQPPLLHLDIYFLMPTFSVCLYWRRKYMDVYLLRYNTEFTILFIPGGWAN